MADDAAKEVNSSHGTEWEVVSLTASAYASSPSPKQVEVTDEVEADQAETSEAMFLSGHFVFPPNQLESLPVELGDVEIQNEQLEGTDNIPQMISDQGGRSDVKDEDNWNLKGLVVSDEIYGMSLSDAKVNKLSVHSSNFEEDVTLQGLNLVDKELPSIYSCIVYDENDETEVTPERVIDMSEEGQSGGTPPFPQSLEHMKDDDDDTNGNPELPGDEAWWKRQAISFYSHAKEANAFWSVFLAATVMGIVILGQHWQHERWQALQLKLKFNINDEMGRMLGPISRFKDMIVGGNRRGSFIKDRSSVQREI
ncbi:ATG8-interacting protein 2-like isoform X2 [Impatiens glandulifera]|uniref:ATG8-interacting protein 2-like isoform X2 n=1 Tax=Impatiens glandulifera TaxID=253017 RepID=UPI001FB0D193|nr:ATG8-interacting protein 2-like isoform X2 [Impatiens glandulifera]